VVVVQKDQQVQQETLEPQERKATQEVLVHKVPLENRDQLATLGIPEIQEIQDQLDLKVKLVRQETMAIQEILDPLVLLEQLEQILMLLDLPVPQDLLEKLDPLVLQGIPEIPERQDLLVHKGKQGRLVLPDQQDQLGRLVLLETPETQVLLVLLDRQVLQVPIQQ
jgi:hypothetical protein